MMDNENNPSLFDSNAPRPLADKIRPNKLSDVVGQQHLLEPNGMLIQSINKDSMRSLILWGPPGSGKTTIARLAAEATNQRFISLSAVFSGVVELRKIFDEARNQRKNGQRTVLFVDEIHRFNRAQQDAFLPVVEDGTLILIGATTENPSFALNNALLSRCQVLVLKRLEVDALELLLKRVEIYENKPLTLSPEARKRLCEMADGDGRFIINIAEYLLGIKNSNGQIGVDDLVNFVQAKPLLYDKKQDSHYNLISALHKSLRGSDVNASLYWLARMLVSGEDPNFIARRLVRFAVEDVGLADPGALTVALSSWDAFERLGSPEGELAIAQAVIYLGSAMKSNSGYLAYNSALKSAVERNSDMPPKHILNAPTNFMVGEGYGEGYKYDHDTKESFSGQNYFPESMTREEYYKPGKSGYEQEITKRLLNWKLLRESYAKTTIKTYTDDLEKKGNDGEES